MGFSLAVARLSAMVALISIAFQAVAAEGDRPIAVEIEKVSEHGALVLLNGDEVCLGGIWAPVASRRGDQATGWRAAWQRIIEETDVFLQADQTASSDRYGCSLATIKSDDGSSLQQILLAAGWALVDPLSASERAGAVDTMLASEDRARSAGLGIWTDKAAWPKAADDLSAWMGTRQLVEGWVRRVSETDRYVYLNFGNDWRTDFTTRLDRKMIDKAGFDVTALDGRKLRVRGVLVESRGPLIDIAHPKQIEFLP